MYLNIHDLLEPTKETIYNSSQNYPLDITCPPHSIRRSDSVINQKGIDAWERAERGREGDWGEDGAYIQEHAASCLGWSFDV